MAGEMNMTVSEIFRTDNGDKYVFVKFEDGKKFAEGKVPDCKIVKQEGFTDAEVILLEQYMKNEQATIFDAARKVNVMRAFLKG
ncbi:MAG: hypothetical protein J5876_04820 [Lachnospiraceae bacterium]|nr:hypothetical protein [Lachnospiraceae bacterium]MBO4461921.1 hypothetical protein [Lachnospiraceae bacterium]MBR4795976.1 hypothetical protein [Lachnospiraceae bacterium]